MVIGHEQCVAESAKARRRDRHSPRRIERTVVNCESGVANAIRIKLANESKIKIRSNLKWRVGDIQRAAETLNVERMKVCGDAGISEVAGDGSLIEVFIEDVNLSVCKINSKEEISCSV